MEKATRIKAAFITVFTFLSSALGILAIPFILLVSLGIGDYFTGLVAAGYRKQEISSYKGLKGIIKKLMLLILVAVGVAVDILIGYTVSMGIDFKLNFIIGTLVCIWLIANEIISILENIKDTGVKLPPFLLPLVENIKSQVEDKGSK